MMFRTIYNVLVEIAWSTAWLFLWPDGRISRRAYAFGCAVIIAVFVSVLWSADPKIIPGMQTQNKIDQGPLALLLTGTAWTTFALYIKRLHDCGIGFFASSDLWVFFGFSILAAPFLIILFFWPGEEEANKYGQATSILRKIRNEVR